jgi:DNA-binding NtrC family response regulator
VGKDLLARWVHDLSERRDRPFVAEICNVPASLMETELFGFVKGAFTGAVRNRLGVFQRVAGGVIYLDEIADLPLPLQARLLRVLEEKHVRPVGGEERVSVDFRLLSSSRRTVEELQDKRVLRNDLLYRINTEVLEIPRLRERKEDIPVLVAGILKEYARQSGFSQPYLHRDVLERLMDYHWPGNIRELENVFERALVTRPLEIAGDMLFSGLKDAEGTAAGTGGGRTGAAIPHLREARQEFERRLLLRALKAHGGNATQAARTLGVTRRYLGTLAEKHGIRLADLRARETRD